MIKKFCRIDFILYLFLPYLNDSFLELVSGELYYGNQVCSTFLVIIVDKKLTLVFR